MRGAATGKPLMADAGSETNGATNDTAEQADGEIVKGVRQRVVSSTFRNRLQIKQDALALALKAGCAAFGWEIVSNLFFNPDEIPTSSNEFVRYSVSTGLGASIGINVGMFASLKISNSMFDGTNEKVFSKKNRIQAAQLFVDTLLTDSLWAIFYRISQEENGGLQALGWTLLFLMGVWFTVVSKGVHLVSHRCMKDRTHSFNPDLNLKNFALPFAVGAGEVGFAVAAILSGKWQLLNGAIENNFLAGLADASFSGVMTSLFAILPYIYRGTKSCIDYPKLVSAPRVFAASKDRLAADGDITPHDGYATLGDGPTA